MLKLYFLLIVVTLFLLNEHFIVLPCVNVWAPLFALIVLFILLSSSSWDETKHYHCHNLWFVYCNTFTTIFSSLKSENGLKKHIQNVAETKYGYKLVVIFFTFLQDVIMWFIQRNIVLQRLFLVLLGTIPENTSRWDNFFENKGIPPSI